MIRCTCDAGDKPGDVHTRECLRSQEIGGMALNPPAMATRGQTCATCGWWDQDGPSDARGYCRRRAPTVLVTKQPNHTGQFEAYTAAIWPPTSGADWCGDWLLKGVKL